MIEVIVNKEDPSKAGRLRGPDDDPYSPETLSEVADHRRRNRGENSSRILAVGTLDVQTALTGSSTRAAAVLEGMQVPFAVKKGAASPLGSTFPEVITTAVGLEFSKAADRGRVEGTQGGEEGVPTLFVVATTLFDCATEMEGAELRLYSRRRDTGDAKILFSAERGAIGRQRFYAALSTVYFYIQGQGLRVLFHEG